MKALFWSAVINGVVAVPRKMVMGAPPKVLGWLCTAVMGLGVGIMVWTW